MIEAILQQFPQLTPQQAEEQLELMKLSCTDAEIERFIDAGWIPMVATGE